MRLCKINENKKMSLLQENFLQQAHSHKIQLLICFTRKLCKEQPE